jgi:hypothetical protein
MGTGADATATAAVAAAAVERRCARSCGPWTSRAFSELLTFSLAFCGCCWITASTLLCFQTGRLAKLPFYWVSAVVEVALWLWVLVTTPEVHTHRPLRRRLVAFLGTLLVASVCASAG